MARAHHAKNSAYKRRQYWCSRDASGMTFTSTSGYGDIIPVHGTRSEAYGGWSYNTSNYGGSEVVVPLTGWYWVGWKFTIDRGSAGSTVLCEIEGAIFVNGTIRTETVLHCISIRANMSEIQSAGFSCPMYLVAGDELQVKGHSNNPSGAQKAGTKADGVALSLMYVDAI